jgi:hypothetical protein
MAASRDDLLDLLHLNFLQTSATVTGKTKTYTGVLADQACTLTMEADDDHLYAIQMTAFLGRAAPRPVREANALLVGKLLRAALGDAVQNFGEATPPAVGEAMTHPGKVYSINGSDAADISSDAAGNVTVRIHPVG